MTNLKRGSIFSILIALSGCTMTHDAVDRTSSLVDLHSEMGNEMIARRLDGRLVQRLDQFSVTPGTHDLEVGIVRDDYQQSHRRCLGQLTYDRFSSDTHYTLLERSSGADVAVALLDANGTTLAESTQLPCL